MSPHVTISAVTPLAWLALISVTLGHDAARLPPVTAPVVTALAIDPAGRRLATGGDDHSVRLWDLQRGDLLRVLSGHQDWVTAVAFSADGQQLFSVGTDGMLACWDVDRGTLRKLHQDAHPLNAVACTSSMDQLLAVGFGTPLRRIAWRRGGAAETLDCPSSDMRVVASAPDGSQFAAGGRDGRIRVWSPDGSILHELVAHDQRLRALAYSPDGHCLVSAGEDRAICVWNTHSGQEISHLDRSEGRILSLVVLSPQRLAVGTSRNAIELWDFKAKEFVGSLKGHSGSVSALARHGEWLVSGGYDAQVRIWRIGAHGDAVAERVLDASARPARR